MTALTQKQQHSRKTRKSFAVQCVLSVAMSKHQGLKGLFQHQSCKTLLKSRSTIGATTTVSMLMKNSVKTNEQYQTQQICGK